MGIRIILFTILSIISLSLPAQTEASLKGKIAKTNSAENWNALAEYYADHNDSINLRKAAIQAYQLAIQENNIEEKGRALMYQSSYERMRYGKYTDTYLTLLEEAAALLSRQKSKYAPVCFQKISQSYNTKGKHDKALYYLFQAEKSCKESNPEIIGSVYCDIGYAYLYKGIPDSALFFTEKALKHALSNQDTISMTVSYSLLGIINRRKNNFSQALSYYLKSAELYEQQKEWKRQVTTWCNIAVLYTDWEKYNQAIEFGRKAIETVERHRLSNGDKSRALLILGIPLLKSNQVREATNVYLKALPYLENSYQKRSCLFGLTKAYYKLNMPDSVQCYMQQLEDEFKQSKATFTDSYYNFKGMMALREQNFHDAIEYYEKSINLQNQQKGGIVQRNSVETYLNLSTAYEKGPHDYKKALHYKNIAWTLQDSIFQQKNNELMSEYYARFETAEKELAIRQLQIEQQQIRYRTTLTFGGFCILIILMGIVLLYNRILRLKKEKEATLLSQRIEQKENEFLTLQKENELRLTRKYIDGLESERERLATELHDDVCNSLMALEMQIRTQDNEQKHPLPETLETLVKIRNRVRTVSHELMPPVFQYATLDEMLEDFITHLHLPEDTKASYQSTPDTDWSSIPAEIGFEFYRIVQEAVNNAAKYASAHKISVELKLEDKELSVVIEDDGIGFDTERKTKGIGLRTIAQRIQSIKGTFKLTSHIGMGTKVIAKISLTSPQQQKY